VEYLTTLDHLTLAGELHIDGTTNRAKRVDILEFHTSTECGRTMRTNRYIDITAKLPLLHVGIRCTTPTHELLELFEVGEDVGLGPEVWLRHNLHKRGACTIVVTESLASCVDELARVVLYMHMMYAECLLYSLDERTYLSPVGNRMIHLCDLVSHREIWVKVALAVEFTVFLDITPECMTRADSEVDDTCRECREHPRKTHTDRTDIGIGFICEFDGILTATKHLGIGLDTNMSLETHDDLVFINI